MDETKILIADSETFIIFGILVLLTIFTAWLTGRFFQRRLLSKSQDERIDITSFVFIKHIVVATIYFFGFGWALLTLPISKNFAHSLFAGAGASTLILGLAAQQILGNMMSGILLIVRRPFKINDTIEIQGNRGKVVEIDLHSTTIEDDKTDKIIIPNSLISSGIIRNVNKDKM